MEHTRREAAAGSGFELREMLAEIVRRLESGHPRIAAEMRELLATNIEDLGGDSQLIDLLQASVESNLSTIFHMLSNGIGLESLKPPTAAIEYAVRLAQHDIQLSALTRAYYLAQSMLLRVTLQEIGKLELPEGAKLEAVRGAADAIHGYIDWMLQRLTEAYGAEHRRWWSARATANTAIVLKVLRGESVSASSFLAETRYGLEQRHLAMVAWIEDSAADAPAQQRLDRLVRQIAALLRSPHTALVSAVDRSTVWSWVAMTASGVNAETRQDIDRIVGEHAGISLSLGGVEFGVAGFRRSHERALAAREVALAMRGRRGSVIADTDANVGLLSLLLKDRQASLAWMHRVLGPFAEAGAGNEAMRETLAEFYDSGQNYSQTAERLGVHRNTVRHRIARFEQAGGRSYDVDPLEVALALRIHGTLDG